MIYFIIVCDDILGLKFIGQLGHYLSSCKDDEDGVAKILVKDHKCFEGYKLSMRNLVFERKSIVDMISDLECKPRNLEETQREALKELYTSFDHDFWHAVENEKIDSIIKKAKLAASRGTKSSFEVRDLLVYVCATWTLSDTSSYDKS